MYHEKGELLRANPTAPFRTVHGFWPPSLRSQEGTAYNSRHRVGCTPSGRSGREKLCMTLDHAVALSLLENLPRVNLTERLRSDPALLEQATPLLEHARVVRERAQRQAIQVIAWNDRNFPTSLATLTDLPPVLWYQGQLAVAESPAIAIVGSRAASSVAIETASRLAGDVAAAGITVVSGLARGVDSAAHRGALQTGRTIAVLGSGLDLVYPAEHFELAKEIALEGVVVSEFPPGTPPLPYHFPMRNRLISGLSLGVVVIEASEKSGSLITASCALEQGREVMAVPGNVLSGRNKGGHALLRDGAKIVETADDIVRELGWLTSTTCGQKEQISGCPGVASGDPLIGAMAPGQPYDVDELTSLTGLETRRLLPRLLDLELRGLVRRAGGGRFVRPF
jgi:DNA processing protein